MPSAPWQAGEAGPVTGSPGTVRCANRRTSCRVAIVKSARNRRTPRASRRASGRRWLARGGTAWSRDLAGYGTPWRGLARCWLRFACHRCMPLITHACALCALARSDADLAACGLRAIAAGSPGLRTVLSTQEDRVARLVAQGMTNQEVARELYVSAKTVEGYRPGTPVRQAGEARHHHRVPSRDMRRVRARHPAGRQDQLRRGWPLRPLRLPGRGQPRRAPAGGNDDSDPAGPLCGLRTGHHPR